MHKKDRISLKDKAFIWVGTVLCVQEAIDLTIFAPVSFNASTRTDDVCSWGQSYLQPISADVYAIDLQHLNLYANGSVCSDLNDAMFIH